MAQQPQTEPPMPGAPRLRWVAAALVVVLGAIVAMRLAGPAMASSRAQALAGELGAELYDRPLLPQELDARLELAPQNGAPPKATTLRVLLQGQDTVIVHFWATWCPPCLDELPQMAKLATLAQQRHSSVVAVASDNDWPAIDATFDKVFGSKKRPAGQWLRDPFGQDGPPDQLLRTSFGTEKLPETWVIRKDRVLARFIGGQPWDSPPFQRWFQAQCPDASGTP